MTWVASQEMGDRADEYDRAMLDEMLRMLDEEGRIAKPHYGPKNKWYRYKRWDIPFNRDHIPEPLQEPPVRECDDERTRELRMHAIEQYCRFVELEDDACSQS